MEGWLEHENGVQALKTWLTVQEEKLKKRHRIEDVASVQNALKDCQVLFFEWLWPLFIFSLDFRGAFVPQSHIAYLQELEEMVKEKEKDLEKAEERGNALIRNEKAAAFPVVKETLKGLNQSWARLDHMVRSSSP